MVFSRDGDVPPTMGGAHGLCGRGVLTPRDIMLVPLGGGGVFLHKIGSSGGMDQ